MKLINRFKSDWSTFNLFSHFREVSCHIPHPLVSVIRIKQIIQIHIFEDYGLMSSESKMPDTAINLNKTTTPETVPSLSKHDP